MDLSRSQFESACFQLLSQRFAEKSPIFKWVYRILNWIFHNVELRL